MSSPVITSPYTPDLEKVQAWFKEMISTARFTELIAAILALICRMRDINLELVKQITLLRRARPGSEKLERLERQLTLPLPGLDERPLKPLDKDAPSERRSKRRNKPHSGGRRSLPEHLPRVEVINSLPPEQKICGDCGITMTTVGYDESESLEIEPARVFILRRKDERAACSRHHSIVSAEAPPRIVEAGVLGNTLIVEATADKYLDKLPVERQCSRFRRRGVPIAPQTLGRSIAAEIDLVAPIARSIHDQTRASDILSTDATGLPVLDQDHPRGIRNGTMWCWIGDRRWVSFAYTSVGGSDSVRTFLGKNLSRVVQCDGTNTLTFLERAGGKRPGCWAHARRRFVEAASGGDTVALDALKKIQNLFAVEHMSERLNETPDARLARRRKCSAPLLADLWVWVDEQRKVIPPKTPLGQALGYLHRQKERLALFLQDGRLELTNNRVERELRSLVVGRKNWLFAYGDLGGVRTAQILTIFATCIAHGVNPRAYLHTVTKLILEAWPNRRLRELLPDRMVDSHPEVRLRQRAPPAQ